VQGPIVNTYANEALQSSSCIDHFFVSRTLKPFINNVCVIDSSCHCSDHRPIGMRIKLVSSLQASSSTSRCTTNRQFKVRWDKGSLTDYYNYTRVNLTCFNFDNSYLQCTPDCNSDYHEDCIDKHYSCIVKALQCSERASVPRIPHTGLRPFWNDYLDELKHKCITWHSIWVSSGRPASGLIQQIKSSVKLNYKLAIKKAFVDYENRFNDELMQHFASKNTLEFWKSWSKKMHRNIEKDVFINGSNDGATVSNAFAQYLHLRFRTGKPV